MKSMGKIQIIGDSDIDPPPILFKRGDPNNSRRIDISDGLFVLNFVFLAGEVPHCMKSADANDDGGIQLSDASYIFNFVFLAGPDPLEPYSVCGLDPTSDALSCESFPECE